MDEQSGKGNRGELAEQILDRIASDGDFRQQLLDNPVETLKQAGYNTSDEVSGYRMGGGVATTAIGCGPGAGFSTGSGAKGGGGGVVTTAMGCGGGGVVTTAMGCGGGGEGTDPAEPYGKGVGDAAPPSKPGPASH